MKLIIVQGGAATGKTTLAKKLAKDLNYKIFLKDDYKEKIYDQHKRINLPKWLKLEEDSYKAIYQAISEAFGQNKNLIIEGNFLPFRKRQLRRAISNKTSVVEVYCQVKGWITFKRFIDRNERGDRHKGHKDRLWYPIVFFEALCAQLGLRLYRPLHLSKHFVKVDTSNPNKINYNEILQIISK